jgi:hypothetical protein
MLDIDRSSHTLSSAHRPPKISRPSHDLVSEEEEEGTDNDCTLAEVIRSKKTSATQEGASSPGGDLFPSHPKEARVAARKRKTSASPRVNDDGTPR